jgi:Glycogen recognition site of AMP-activated protein kinase
MDAVTISRRIAKMEYMAVRRPFALFDDRLLARYWNEDAVVRSGFGRVLGSLDRFAGWLLADDTISQRGRDLLRRTGPGTGVWEHAALDEVVPTESISQEPFTEPIDVVPAPPAAPETPAALETPAAPRAVDVTFNLPGEVGAGHVALCGDFNDWSASGIALHRGSDGAWQVTLPLEPGQSYRFRYLLDGECWENAWQADWYEPNPFGSTNSVVVVNSPETLGLAA